ncbi:hypothetical protein A2U01_0062569, partial [Trifolium medium]|nr:hypothetical protein [Trifolium medium]
KTITAASHEVAGSSESSDEAVVTAEPQVFFSVLSCVEKAEETPFSVSSDGVERLLQNVSETLS